MIEYENLKKTNRQFLDSFQKAFSEVCESGWFVLGSHVGRFEREFAVYQGAGSCVGVGSGLDALSIVLKGLGLENGSEVIVPSNTYIATILSVLNCGLKPVLVEPDLRTYNIDPAKIEEKMTPRTRAIMAVHLYGKSCEMDPIMDLCRRAGAALVEDCAQSHGASYKGVKTGNFGVGAFSFYPTKNLGALGDAGGIVTSDPELERKFRALRNYGSARKYYNDLVGVNSRLDEIQAAFLSVKLKKLDEINAHKRKLASLYLDNLKDDFVKPVVHPDFFDVYHIFSVRHRERDALRQYLLEKGITTEIHYPIPPHRQKAMEGILDGSYPISEEIHSTTLSLPISFGNTEEEILRVIDVMNGFRPGGESDVIH